jgi:hypothetical protein
VGLVPQLEDALLVLPRHWLPLTPLHKDAPRTSCPRGRGAFLVVPEGQFRSHLVDAGDARGPVEPVTLGTGRVDVVGADVSRDPVSVSDDVVVHLSAPQVLFVMPNYATPLLRVSGTPLIVWH